MSGATSELWRVDDGGLPDCPVGSIVWFVNDGPTAQVIRQGHGAVGTISSASTTQTASANGAQIVLVNGSEGWQAKLSRVAATIPSTWPAPLAAPAPQDHWVRSPGWQAEIDAAARPDRVVRRYSGKPTVAIAAYQLDAGQMAAAGWYATASLYEKEPIGWARVILFGWIAFLFRPPGSLVVTYERRSG